MLFILSLLFSLRFHLQLGAEEATMRVRTRDRNTAIALAQATAPGAAGHTYATAAWVDRARQRLIRVGTGRTDSERPVRPIQS